MIVLDGSQFQILMKNIPAHEPPISTRDKKRPETFFGLSRSVVIPHSRNDRVLNESTL